VERGLHAIAGEIAEECVGVDRRVGADLLAEVGGVFRQLTFRRLAGLFLT
jgi:hypothetical protein